MRIVFVALSAPGHLNPTTALARQLHSRNHEVVLISLPDAEPYIRAAGLAFLPLQLVLSVGDRVEPDQIGPAPNNAIIEHYGYYFLPQTLRTLQRIN